MHNSEFTNIEIISKKYPILNQVIEKLISYGITSLYPPQVLAIENGLLDGKNFLIATGTGSGKTLLAELLMTKNYLEQKTICVYIVPLRALAMEKFEEFQKKYRFLGMKFRLLIGDYDSSEKEAGKSDVIVCTFEKLDSLIRNNAVWLKNIGTVIIDEVHEIGDKSRGPTLEIVITKLKELSVQILALSATIGNALELSQWLGAELIESNFRPLPLEEGIVIHNTLDFGTKKYDLPKHKDAITSIVQDTLTKGYQGLLFVNSKKSAESLAKKFAMLVFPKLTAEERGILAKASEKIKSVYSPPTAQCTLLSEVIKKGVSFHHAGLANEQRKIVESLFRQRYVKFLFSTVTLVAGVNLPCRRIIIQNIKRYTDDGIELWPVSLYKQAVGRSGRVGYDTKGEGIVIAKSLDEAETIYTHYINGTPEPIQSHLGVRPILRMHLLGLIGSTPQTPKGIQKFFASTFYGFKLEEKVMLEKLIAKTVEDLEKWNFIKVNKIITPTKLGKLVARLYLDPMCANILLEGLNQGNPDSTELSYLHLICYAGGIKNLYLSQKDENWIYKTYSTRQEEFLVELDDFDSYKCDRFFRALKTGLMFEAWVQEQSEKVICEKYSITPGALNSNLQIAEWLVYALQQFAALQNMSNKKDLLTLRLRLKYGVRKELSSLVQVPGIGRVRARLLFRHNIKNISDLKKIGFDKLGNLIGRKTAKKVYEHLGYSVNQIPDKENTHKKITLEKSLLDFM